MPAVDSVQRYIEKLRPLCGELYRRAHVIVGNSDIAEFVLQNAIAEAYARKKEWQGKIGFREALTSSVREEALDELNRAMESGSYERDPDDVMARSLYGELPLETADAAQQQLASRILREKPYLQRALMLKYGCGLSTKEIAFVLQTRHKEVSDALRLFAIRMDRALKKQNGPKGVLERRLVQLSEEALRRPGGDIPDVGTIFQFFDESMEKEKKAGARVGRAVRGILLALGALLCAFLFWLIAVLLEPHTPTQSETPDAAQEMRADPAFVKLSDETQFFI